MYIIRSIRKSRQVLGWVALARELESHEMRCRTWIALVALSAVVSCVSPDNTIVVSAGEWGGQNADLRVTQSGATAQFKCGAVGVVPKPLTLDASGGFDVAGTYETPVVQVGPRPARFTGSVSGSSMTLDVTVSDSHLGPFTLRLGDPPAFEPCNF